MKKKEFLKQFDEMVKDETRTCMTMFTRSTDGETHLVRIVCNDFDNIRNDIETMFDKDLIMIEELDGEALPGYGTKILKIQ